MSSGVTPSTPLHSLQPELGVAHPLKIGKSLRHSRLRRQARDFLALRFTHVPDKTDVHRAGHLTRSKDEVTVALPATDGASFTFTGARRSAHAGCAVSDYLLVVVDDVVWLERAADFFYRLKPVAQGQKRLQLTEDDLPEASDDVTADPDSWMADDVDSSSPISPEEDDPEDVAAAAPVTTGTGVGTNARPDGGNTGENALTNVAQAASRTPQTAAKTPSASGAPHMAAAAAAAAAPHAPHAAKSVAGKTLAAKSVPKPDEPKRQRNNNNNMSDDDDDGSSSDDDDSDESDSDSDSDSGGYTDRTSDSD